MVSVGCRRRADPVASQTGGSEVGRRCPLAAATRTTIHRGSKRQRWRYSLLTTVAEVTALSGRYEPASCVRFIGTARRMCAAGSEQLSGVRLSVPSGRCTPLPRICCRGPGGHEISIDCCTASGPAVSSRCAAAACGSRMRAVPRCQLTQEAEHRLAGSVQRDRPRC